MRRGFRLPHEMKELPVHASMNAARLARCSVIIPTCNASPHWEWLHGGLQTQGIVPDQVLIIDSSSTDDTARLARQVGYRLHVISRASFRHGATRNLAAALQPEAEYLIYLTQDAVLCHADSLSRLVQSFEDPQVGAAYGRQLPRPGADAIERHARVFNYPDTPAVRCFANRASLGFRTAYFSNSFAAYRRSAFDALSGFPDRVIVSEEVSLAARMLMAGWKLAYSSESQVYHSHKLSVGAEFSRYFDIAVHHSQERWIMEHFGSVGGEGLNFVRSEFRFLQKHAPQLIPLALLRSMAKWTAYQIGRRADRMPLWLKRTLSAQPTYWKEQNVTSEKTTVDCRLEKSNGDVRLNS